MIELLTLLLSFYLTGAIMAIGAGLMLGGPPAAAAVARFCFLRPVIALLRGILAALRWLAGEIWVGVRSILTRTWWLLRDFLLWPLARGSLAVLRLAAVGFADTLHFLFTGRGR
jgi:hypothetical protein